MEFKQFLNEISKKDLEGVDLDRDLFFDDIFGDKLRIVIPLQGNEEIDDLIKKLENMNYEVDYHDLINKKIAYKKIMTKAGVKKRPEKVGGILQTIIKNYDKIKSSQQSPLEKIPSKSELIELLDWWQKNSASLQNQESGSSVIISRSPMDLVRMSDHDGITSCHNPKGGYFKCAKQEARTGGAVAYVVKNTDIKDIDVQKPELFKDKTRKIEGVIPLERLRLRRFTNGKIDILVPELRTYGIKNIGFINAVKNWARNIQKHNINQFDPEKDYEKFNLAGGSYQDSSASSIWSDFFGKVVHGGKDSIDADKEEKDEDDLEERAERQLQDHKPNWKVFDVNFEIHGDDNNLYLDYSAYGGFSIPIRLFTVDLDNKANWNNVEEVITNEIDIYKVENLDFQVYKENYHFHFSVYDEGDGYGGQNQLTKFEHFLDYIDDIDNRFNDKLNKVLSALIEHGYLKSVVDKIEFENFDSEVDEYGTTITSVPEKLGFLNHHPVAKNDMIISYADGQLTLKKIKEKFVNYINEYKVFPFYLKEKEIKIYATKPTAQGWSKSTDAVSGTTEKSGIPSFHFLTGWVYFVIEKTLSLDMISDKTILKKIINVDRNYEFYAKKLQKLFEALMKRELDAIKKVYPNIVDIAKDPDYEHKIRSNNLGTALNLKLPTKPVVPPKSPYVQKQFKFECFRNWIKNK